MAPWLAWWRKLFIMKKIFLLAIAVALLCCPDASAQWKKGYKQNDWQVGYGYLSCIAVVDALGDVEMDDVTQRDVETDSRASIGAITAQYTHRGGRLVSFGLALSYEMTKEDCIVTPMKNTKVKVGELTNTYISVTPLLRFNWVEWNGLVTMYSKLAIGMTFIGDSYSAEPGCDYSVQSKKQHYFGYQVSPVGVMVGRRLSGFAEVGFGTHGLAQVGVAYRF